MDTREREQLYRDEVRATVLAYLHDRPTVAQSADTIARTLRPRGHSYSAEDVRDACVYWAGLQDLERHYPAGSGTPHFRITSRGINTYERSLV